MEQQAKNIVMEKLIKLIEKYPNKPWNWYRISHNSNLTIEMIEKLKHSNKILLPESLLFELTKENHDSLDNKMYFKVSHTETGYVEVCGVHEFSDYE